MKGKTFLTLLVAACVLAALMFLRFSDRQQPDATRMGQELFPDLPLNQIASIAIADAENSVTLIKGNRTWQVKERNGYPADFGQLRDVAVKLSRLKIGRRFDGTPESLARLSLLAPSDATETGRGTRVTLKDPAEKVLADVILGQTRQTEDGGSGGQYLKRVGENTVFLVDGSFRFLKTAPPEWLDDEILDVKADDVASVTCYAGGSKSPVYALARPEKGKKPRLSPAPSKRRADPAKIDQVFDALAPLTLDDVVAAENPQAGGGGADRLVYRLYDGRQVTIYPESDGNENYRLRVTAEEIAAEPAAAHAAEVPADDSKAPDQASGVETSESEKDKDAPAIKSARQINDELGPWVFSIKKWQFDSFITTPEALLETDAQKEGGAS